MKCRHCSAELINTFLDLGFAPPSNAYLTKEDLRKPEKYYPLKVMVCDQCWLVQTEDYADAEDLFDEAYAYFSSTSQSWLEHARNYVDMIVGKLGLTEKSFVIEIASNDGYLLKNFVEKNIPCLGIEPTSSTANIAVASGIPVLQDFFGNKLAESLLSRESKADLIIGNNVFAHVPNINDFSLGLKKILKSKGVITLEFPHLLRLIEGVQFDTIYHEHFSYLSLCSASRILSKAGLKIWDVEEIPTHGGSLRIYASHEDSDHLVTPSVDKILVMERDYGLEDLAIYKAFQHKADAIKNNFIQFLVALKERGDKVVAYGAAAKGNTLLNYAGIKPDLLPFVCDAALAKQNKFMPGSHIPIRGPEVLTVESFGYVVIFPWNIASEVIKQYQNKRESGVKFVIVTPEIKFL